MPSRLGYRFIRLPRMHDKSKGPRDGTQWTVRANVPGNFPGSPVRLDHVFELAGDAIRSLEIRGRS